MITIYFTDNSLTFVPEDYRPSAGDVVLSESEVTSANIDNLFDTCNSIVVLSIDCAAAFNRFAKRFEWVEAAGGVVENAQGQVLMIFRRGRWDLPKGHQDPGEEISVTALREVQEETGIDELVLRDLICITDHCYIRDGKWHLKHTWWYDMLYTDPTDLTPQTEEDISKAAWVAKSSLPPFLLNTYPSIIEVFREAKI
jgi:ADP-ribose pyrophosphatase YjhB (NUDIX family)